MKKRFDSYDKLFGAHPTSALFDLSTVPDAASFYQTELARVRKSAGPWWTARCPFHDDQHPSFAFNVETGRWRCHAGCGSGSMVDFVMRRYGVRFKQACDRLGLHRG